MPPSQPVYPCSNVAQLVWRAAYDPNLRALLARVGGAYPPGAMLSPEDVAKLRSRVQERAALYTEDGMDPLAVEDLLDDVNVALGEFQALLTNPEDDSSPRPSPPCRP